MQYYGTLSGTVDFFGILVEIDVIEAKFDMIHNFAR